MEENIRLLLQELEQWGQNNDASTSERSQKMLNLERDTAQLLSILVRSGNHKKVLEIGTSNGYSTIWLAWSIQKTGGHLISIEHNPAKQAMAEVNVERAGLVNHVTLLLGDAAQVLEGLDGPFDCVFLDADRWQYPQLLRLLWPKLNPSGLLLADNVHSHPEQIAAYLQAIDEKPDLEHVVIGVGKGLSVAMKG